MLSKKILSGLTLSIGLMAASHTYAASACNTEPPAIWADLMDKRDGKVDHIESEYNDIFVTKSRTYLKMSFRRYGKNYTESIVNMGKRDDLPVAYAKYMTLGAAYSPNLKTMLMIGLGGGSTTSYMARAIPDLKVDVVEIDPGVITAARKYFDLCNSDRYNIHKTDGRIFLKRNKTKYDIIMIDAFRGGYIPFHLLTQEFFQLMSDRLTPEGVVVFNLHGNTKLFVSAVKTLGSVFADVDLFRVNSSVGNVVAVAYNNPADGMSAVFERAITRQNEYGFAYPITSLIQKRMPASKLDIFAKAQLLTDDFAPVNLYEKTQLKTMPKW